MADISYNELAVAKIQERRNIVISQANKGGYTLAQQIVVEEGNRETKLFLKHGIIFDDLAGLYNLRDALNVAIEKEEKRIQFEKDNEVEWDEPETLGEDEEEKW